MDYKNTFYDLMHAIVPLIMFAYLVFVYGIFVYNIQDFFVPYSLIIQILAVAIVLVPSMIGWMTRKKIKPFIKALLVVVDLFLFWVIIVLFTSIGHLDPILTQEWTLAIGFVFIVITATAAGLHKTGKYWEDFVKWIYGETDLNN